MSYLKTVAEIKNAIANPIEKIALYSQAPILWMDTEVADYKTKQPRLSLIQISSHSTDLTGEKALLN